MLTKLQLPFLENSRGVSLHYQPLFYFGSNNGCNYTSGDDKVAETSHVNAKTKGASHDKVNKKTDTINTVRWDSHFLDIWYSHPSHMTVINSNIQEIDMTKFKRKKKSFWEEKGKKGGHDDFLDEGWQNEGQLSCTERKSRDRVCVLLSSSLHWPSEQSEGRRFQNKKNIDHEARKKDRLAWS